MNKIVKKFPKLVVTDWDGTFSEQGGSPRDEAIQAKDELLKNGSLVVLVSGRSSIEVLRYIKDYKLSPEFIAELGTVIYHQGKELINHGDLQNYHGAPLYNEFANYLDTQHMSAHDAIFAIGIVDKVLEIAQANKMPLRIFTPKDGHPGEAGVNVMKKKGTVLLRGKIETDIINSYLFQKAPFLEIKDNGLVEDKSGEHAYHLLIKGANKDSAVQLLQKLLNITKEESIALGDSLSDLSLALVVGRFYLMRNGLSHTPDMLERFRKTLQNISEEKQEQIMKRIIITKENAGLGWTESINSLNFF